MHKVEYIDLKKHHKHYHLKLHVIFLKEVFKITTCRQIFSIIYQDIFQYLQYSRGNISRIREYNAAIVIK